MNKTYIVDSKNFYIDFFIKVVFALTLWNYMMLMLLDNLGYASNSPESILGHIFVFLLTGILAYYQNRLLRYGIKLTDTEISILNSASSIDRVIPLDEIELVSYSSFFKLGNIQITLKNPNHEFFMKKLVNLPYHSGAEAEILRYLFNKGLKVSKYYGNGGRTFITNEKDLPPVD